MDMIIVSLKSKDRKKVLIVLLCFFAVILLKHLSMKIISDDKVNIEQFRDSSFLQAIRYRYETNGRIFTDGAAYLFEVRVPFAVWKVFDSLVYAALAGLIACAMRFERVLEVMVTCAMLLAFPMEILNSAGWIATSTNYVYPVLCLLLALIPAYHVVTGRKTPWYLYPLAVFGVLYVTNHDQYACVIAGGLLVTLLYCLYLKRQGHALAPGCLWSLLLWLIISVVSYLVQFMMPGHINRMNSTLEMETYLPQYAKWSFFEKVYRGFSSTVSWLFFSREKVVLILLMLLFLLGLGNKRKSVRVISAVPFACRLIIEWVGYRQFVVYKEVTFHAPEFGSLGKMKTLFALGLSILIITGIVLSIWFLLDRIPRFASLLLLLLGAGSREMMGFSPTIYASGYRTFTFMLFALIGCCLILWRQMWKSGDRIRMVAATAVILAVGVI